MEKTGEVIKLKNKYLAFSMMICLLLTACSKNSASNENKNYDKVYTLRVNTALSESDPIFIGLRDVFKKNVEERTNGKIIVDLFSGGQLGTDEDVLEQAIVGDSVGVISDPGRLGNYVYEFSVLQAPYIV